MFIATYEQWILNGYTLKAEAAQELGMELAYGKYSHQFFFKKGFVLSTMGTAMCYGENNKYMVSMQVLSLEASGRGGGRGGVGGWGWYWVLDHGANNYCITDF